MEKQKVNLDETTYTFTVDGDVNKEVFVKIKKPAFDAIIEANKYLYGLDGTLDTVTPGKIILEMCSTDYSKEIDDDNRIKFAICQVLTGVYVTPAQLELKKN